MKHPDEPALRRNVTLRLEKGDTARFTKLAMPGQSTAEVVQEHVLNDWLAGIYEDHTRPERLTVNVDLWKGCYEALECEARAKDMSVEYLVQAQVDEWLKYRKMDEDIEREQEVEPPKPPRRR